MKQIANLEENEGMKSEDKKIFLSLLMYFSKGLKDACNFHLDSAALRRIIVNSYDSGARHRTFYLLVIFYIKKHYQMSENVFVKR